MLSRSEPLEAAADGGHAIGRSDNLALGPGPTCGLALALACECGVGGVGGGGAQNHSALRRRRSICLRRTLLNRDTGDRCNAIGPPFTPALNAPPNSKTCTVQKMSRTKSRMKTLQGWANEMNMRIKYYCMYMKVQYGYMTKIARLQKEINDFLNCCNRYTPQTGT